uniref:CCD97-like C-terminal domain-containing protein n=1 Tax=Chenopodium quinoa TaxID=63459 RepID=A0A803LUB7_CHEQI
MDKLMSEGNYFSEDAMREREPYLHHEYVGKFQDPYGRSMPRPGERWSETLMRRAEEAILLTKIRGEQQRLGVHESEWVQPVHDQNGITDGTATASSMNIERPVLSPAEMQEQLDQFTYIMQQKFLSGQDHEHVNYSKIDEDETLDDHWSKEANYDAEEKYFEED